MKKNFFHEFYIIEVEKYPVSYNSIDKAKETKF